MALLVPDTSLPLLRFDYRKKGAVLMHSLLMLYCCLGASDKVLPVGGPFRPNRICWRTQEALLLDNATWEPCAQLAHCEVVPESEQLVVYEEVEDLPPQNAPAAAQPPQSRPTPAPHSKPGDGACSNERWADVGKQCMVVRVSAIGTCASVHHGAQQCNGIRSDWSPHMHLVNDTCS